MQKTAPFSMRLAPELKEHLQRIANRERRSLTNLVEKVLSDFVETDAAKKFRVSKKDKP